MDLINTVGIIGAGTMGSALAQKFSQTGLKVILVDTENRFLENALKNVKETLSDGIKRGLFTEEKTEEILSYILTTTDLNKIDRCQLVIEAVFEDKVVKEQLFKEVSLIVPGNTIIATNTSSFSISELAPAVAFPERFLGLHFFYHAAKNRLVEVVKGDQTDEDIFKTALWFMQRCGKDPITCKDAHGFVVNRFFVPWLNEAVRLYEEKVAGMGAIDTVACQTFGCGMGPFALMNATGVPIAYHAQKTLADAYGKFYQPAEALREQAESNRTWDIEKDETVTSAVAEQIAQRLLGVTFLVCGQLLDEKICVAGDINRGANIGLRWRKGPLELFHRYGEESVHRLVDSVVDTWPIAVPKCLTLVDWQPDYIIGEKDGGAGTITINRPEGLNAMNPTVISQLAATFDKLNGDDSIETIFITGRGKAFVAGADIKYFIDHIRNNTIAEIVDFTTAGQALFQRIDESPKTVVVMVNGLTLGGGLELALTADIIVALNSALMAFPETGIGIYPGLGGTQRTVSRIGRGLTKYLVYTGQMLSAGKASQIGLIDKVVTWNELHEVMKNPKAIIKTPVVLTDQWRKVKEFFNRYTVEQLLSANDFSEEWSGIVKKVRWKAPRALQLAEILINEQKGPASELEHLEEIFRTEDALSGLQSVGRKPPQFKGR